MGKFNVVFGDEAGRTIKALDEMTGAIGRSKFEAREFAASFQDTFVPMGFARDSAADLATQLTQLTYDVASFNNSLEPDVARDFQSALVGNHETVRKYGIVITQAALDAELFRMGIEDGAKGATEQEKVMARLNLIMAGTSDAHGDAARTADSWANTMRRLQSSITDTATEMGSKLLPVLSPLLDKLADAAQRIGPSVVAEFTKIVETISTLGQYFILVAEDGDYLNDWLWHLPTSIQAVVQSIGEMINIFGENGLAGGLSVLWSRISEDADFHLSWLQWFLRFKLQTTLPIIQEQLATWGTAFWDWLVGENGALVQASAMLGNISIEFEKWVQGSGQELMKSVGMSIGTAIGNGVKWLFSAEGGGSDETINAVFASMMESTARNVANFQSIGATIETYIIVGFVEAITGQDVAEETAATIRNVLLNIVKLTSPGSIGIELFNGIWTPFKNAWDSSISFLKGEGATATVGEMMPFGLGNVLPGFAGGGEIPGREGQAVPIMAHAGEVVLNREQQAAMAREPRVYINNLNLNGVQNVSSFLAELEALT